MDLLLFNPRNRAMLWGVFAGFTYAATSGTQNVIAEIDKNIQKIDEILQMHHEQGFGRELAKNAADDKNKQDKGEIDKDGLDGKNNQGRVNSGKSSNQNVNKENESITLDEPLPCYTGPDAKNCRSFSDTLAGLKSFNSLDSGTKKQLMSLATGLNGVNGTQTISGATLNSAAEIGANSQALNKTMAAMKKELKDGYTLKGKKASLDEVGKELDKDFLSVVNDGARAQNMTPRQLMASIQGTTPSALTFDSKKEVEGDLKKEGEGDLKALSLGEFLSGDELNNADANALSENDLNKEGAGTSNDKSLQLTSGKDDVKDNAIDLSQYDINDISKEGNNLFEVISKRYQKSAYTRLFPKLNEKVNAVEEKKK